MYERCNRNNNNTFYKIELMVGVSRYRHKGGRRSGVEVAEVADVEEVVEAGIFGPSHRLRVGAEVVHASNAGK